MDCGSAVSIEPKRVSREQPVWSINSYCVKSGSTLRECVIDPYSPSSQITELNCSESVRLVNGTSLCSGRVEVKTKQSWASVCEADFDQQDAEVVCRELGCGAPSVLQGALYGEVEAPFWTKEFQCEGDESLLLDCGTSGSTRNTCSPGKAVGLTCSESVRLVNGASLCSGRVEVKTKQSWASVCEADFDQQDAEVVCRELGCGAPSVLRGALYGEVEAPFWTKEFQCKGYESLLLDCGTSGSTRNTCSPGKAVGLTCSASRCAGRLEVKHQEDWRPLNYWSAWNLKSATVLCRQMDCDSAVSIELKRVSREQPVWSINSDCVESGSTLRECVIDLPSPSSQITELNCSESVRLVNGASLCSGRVEVKTKQSWASVCEADFDQQDAEVVCRELGCGAPSVLQGALYGEAEAPFWTKEFQCKGYESLLLDCGTSGSTRNTCSPGKAVGLTCSESVRLVNGASLCSGRVEVKTKQPWASVCEADFDQQDAEVVCRELGCGAPSVLRGALYGEVEAPFWTKEFQCEGDESLLLDCGTSGSTRNTCSPGKAVGLTCSESVRLVNGASLCSGRVEVKTKQSWASVCEADFDQQDAEVVCRELGCGAPSVLQGALYGEAEAPFWTKEFQCEGDESLLLDCGTSGSTRNTCSPGKAVGLTCSGWWEEPVAVLVDWR
ncbi:scavenger receptor cysteine-rich type 1 protein M130-like [Polymixia lowei]